VRDAAVFARVTPQSVALASADIGDSKDAITFVGDILPARNVEVLMDRYGPDYPFSGLSLPSLHTNAAIVGNLESAIPEKHQATPALNLTFSTRSSFVDTFIDHEYTHLSIANNHSDDFGVRGLANTISLLTEADLQVFGETPAFAYDSISTLSTDYGRIALIGLDDTVSPLTRTEMKAVLRKAEAISDFQVVYIHWGIEYDMHASPRQKQVATMLVEAGADLIVGHHPHVVQNIDVIDTVPVFYSLGNYIFDQYFSDEVQTGLAITLSFKPDPVITLTPVESMSRLSQPRPMLSDQKAAFLYELSRRSNSEIAPAIRRGVVSMEEAFATVSKIAMITTP
jgi:poly-gamma-glutamate synthesis protein (capsule biosynthesis protein)